MSEEKYFALAREVRRVIDLLDKEMDRKLSAANNDPHFRLGRQAGLRIGATELRRILKKIALPEDTTP